jgi:hypothetical protein
MIWQLTLAATVVPVPPDGGGASLAPPLPAGQGAVDATSDPELTGVAVVAVAVGEAAVGAAVAEAVAVGEAGTVAIVGETEVVGRGLGPGW